ncbi:PREDICTED: uncharacterized protein LOC104604489 [Nelumbo nucifera]|uniref:Uncharacterized protein n=2 Tax=Nelumbo nucifera TaxID=4432 RepID=A0A822ZV65_NELNU|nr:PREDICTED: uncharacterized protein LOC104604489 [Nelumbo nucifera]DAD48873.1 TPA_asm: hypothetical protein HUJ06_018810 [Nelumbo nucifera]
MPKNNTKSRSSRKPLMDVSNVGRLLEPANKRSSQRQGKVEDDDALDRLLLAHSGLSNLIQQIDELVVQAFKLKLTIKERGEIESFTHVLSDVCSSLKSWVPRFQKVLSSSSVEFENKTAQPLASKVIVDASAASKEISNVVDSPKQPEVDSLVSPSPLVSWRADCTVERGKQLFLLTPLPRSKALSSKSQGTSTLVFKRITHTDPPPNTTIGSPSLLTTSKNMNDDFLEELELKPLPNKSSNSHTTQIENSLACGSISPPRFSKKDQSMFLMTPCLKMSPPQSCVLLEPISRSSYQNNDEISNTPFVVGIGNSTGSQISELSSSKVSEDLALKYPELFGPHPPHKWGIGRKEIEASPGWFLSPPKTCVLMEPPKEKLQMDPAANRDSSNVMLSEQTNPKAEREKDVYGQCSLARVPCNKELCSKLGVLESTPMWKESESIIRTGKQPGENTLKRELWTKFEAASTNAMPLKISIFTETGRKGFLDRLDEVSCEEGTLLTKGL